MQQITQHIFLRICLRRFLPLCIHLFRGFFPFLLPILSFSAGLRLCTGFCLSFGAGSGFFFTLFSFFLAFPSLRLSFSFFFLARRPSTSLFIGFFLLSLFFSRRSRRRRCLALGLFRFQNMRQRHIGFIQILKLIAGMRRVRIQIRVQFKCSFTIGFFHIIQSRTFRNLQNIVAFFKTELARFSHNITY